MAKKTKMVIGTSAAALALLAGLGFAGVASAADTSGTTADATKATTSSAPPERGRDGGHGGHGGHLNGDMAADLAKKLGVDEAKVGDALKTFREANKPAERTKDTARPDRSKLDEALAKSLAGSLGIEESKVTSALEEFSSAARGERAAGLKSRLDAAVGNGTLTQAEADAVTKAVDKGVIGGR